VRAWALLCSNGAPGAWPACLQVFRATRVDFEVTGAGLGDGEALRVVGAGAALGSWEPAHGLPLQPRGDAHGAAAQLEAGPLSFKARRCVLGARHRALGHTPTCPCLSLRLYRCLYLCLMRRPTPARTLPPQAQVVRVAPGLPESFVWEDGEDRFVEVPAAGEGGAALSVACRYGDVASTSARLAQQLPPDLQVRPGVGSGARASPGGGAVAPRLLCTGDRKSVV
jgi:hypothetical protein